MERIMTNGPFYAQQEIARLQKMMSGHITGKQAGELGLKVSVLQDFTETVQDLEELAKSFISMEDIANNSTSAESKSYKKGALAKARKLVKDHLPDDKTAALYPKIMEKILKKGPFYVKSEIERLKSMISGQKITQQQKEEFARKVKVLKVFKSG